MLVLMFGIQSVLLVSIGETWKVCLIDFSNLPPGVQHFTNYPENKSVHVQSGIFLGS